MGYLPRSALEELGFKYLGQEVKISDSAKIYNADQIMIGDNSRIDDFCVLSGKLELGRNVFMGVHGNLAGGIHGIKLADFVTMAYYVNLFTQSDDYYGHSLTNSTIPRKYKQEKFGRLEVGKHAIIGSNSVIMPDAHIAEGCAIGAMSLVTKPTEPWGIYRGIPAKRVKERERDLLKLEQLYLLESE
ncbi:dTDP-3-amino-3,6-dideoxy-alpha-D-galactopyranose 3-N-acetyltransferase [Legionella massiliensis]|uniref:Chloramphenicol acetyltransferase n=1 Tax=Legionella massiliensis TaxID=1034943 RepID=A0A078L0H8_9GAMM|nr:acyltransferase [Legionella massiliensis]CDZ77503.1 dTDP-3-amino-3,6-dideoxy-alpha-D-galactopyranose 3-N-acetyltransferase [Legionella massiliensis]CEE13241.1 dTDP-4-amino-4,6-dideoxy-D-glucose acyltransferase [Legionella massiliensis]